MLCVLMASTLLAWVGYAQTTTPVCSYRVINLFPHDPGAYTQGLELADGELFEGTGLYGQSSIRRVDFSTGEVLQMRPLSDSHFGEGITLWGPSLIQLTYRSHIGFVYDRESFEPVGQVTYPTEGWGLTHDSQRLIMSDGSADLFFRDPETFAELGRVEVHDHTGPIRWLNELELVGGEVYANVWQTDRIARIEPSTGEVVAWVDLSGLLDPYVPGGSPGVLNGIAYDAWSNRLLVTGKRWPLLFEIELVDCPPLPVVFADSFEGGNTRRWSPPSPGIRLGARRVSSTP